MLEYVKAKNLKEGDILAKPIHDERGMMLMAAGTKLTGKAIEAVRVQGFKGLYVEHVEKRERIEIPEPLVDDMDTLHVITTLRDMFRNDKIVDDPFDAAFSMGLKELRDFLDDVTMSFMRLNADKKLLFEFEDARNAKTWFAAHSYYTCLISIAICVRMGLGLKFMFDCGMAALLHDLGKTKYPKLMMKKNPSSDEVKKMQEHPRVMFETLQKINMPVDTLYGIWQHHERMDGSGYPKGITGDKINLSARIVGLASAYDELVSVSPLNEEPMIQGEAIEYLMGNQTFATDVVRALTEVIAPYAIGEWVDLSDGTKGLVIKNHPGLPLRPDVSVFGMRVSLATEQKYRNVTVVGPSEENL